MKLSIFFISLFLFIDAHDDCNYVHLHLSKTIYLSGESIGFKAYVYDAVEQKAVLEGRDVTIDLTDDEGNSIYHSTILYKPIGGFSTINLKDELESGLYYLTANLQTKSGGQCGNPYVQEIKVIDNNGNFNKNKDYKPNIEFKALYNDDYLIANAINSLGFKITSPSSKLSKSSVVILKDDKNAKIAEAQVTESGFGKLSFIPQNNYKYFLELNHNDTTLVRNLPLVRNEGISLNIIKNYNKKSLIVNLISNTQDNSPLHDELKLKIRGHKFLFEREIDAEKMNQWKGLILNLEDLPSGLLHFVLENSSGQVIANQFTFNNKYPTEKKLTIDLIGKDKDSLELQIQCGDSQDIIQRVYSVSVVPDESRAIMNRKNVYFSFYLNHLETDTRLNEFYDYNFDLNSDLDLTLFGQKIYLNDSFEKNHYGSFDYAKGYNLNGFINGLSNKDNFYVILKSWKAGIFEKTTLNKNGTFSFPNINLTKGQEITMLLIDGNGQVINKSSKLNFKITPTGKSGEISTQWNMRQFSWVGFDNTLDDFQLLNNSSEQVIDLEEVIVKGNKLKYENLISGQYYGRKIDSTLHGFGSLKAFIRTYGYRSTYIPPSANSRPDQDGFVFIKNTGSGKKLFPKFVLNGKSQSHPDAILNTPMELIEEVYYNGGGLNDGGTFIIFSREIQSDRNVSDTYVLDEGFDAPTDYRLPLYNSFNNALFRYYGQLYWSPSVGPDSGSNTKFKFAHRGLSSFRIVIEGIDELGEVYYLNTIFSIN